MTATKLETIKIGGWTAKPRDEKGYWIYDARNEFRGYCPADQIVEHLKEESGENYRALPAVKPSDIKCVKGEKISDGRPFGNWYRHDVYSVNDKEIGIIQVRSRLGKIDTLTLSKEHGVMGSDLKWLCKMSGLRLEE